MLPLQLGCWGIWLLRALLLALQSLAAGFRHSLLSRLCFVSRTVRVCVAFLFGVCVAVLLELTELAKPVDLPRLCCDTHACVELHAD